MPTYKIVEPKKRQDEIQLDHIVGLEGTFFYYGGYLHMVTSANLGKGYISAFRFGSSGNRMVEFPDNTMVRVVNVELSVMK